MEINRSSIAWKGFRYFLESEFRSLFKVALLLFGVCLIGLSQTFPTLVENDYKTKKVMFEIEAREKAVFSSINCKSLNGGVAECNYIRYRLSADQNATDLAIRIIVTCFWIGFFVAIIACIGLVLSASTKVHHA